MTAHDDIPVDAVRARYAEARRQLAGNIQRVYGFDRPVLVEGGRYPGVWLECAPQEGLIGGRFDRDVALANHDVFFHHQREDGYIPYSVRADGYYTGQIQMVVPIAATAWELAQRTGDEAFLARAYDASCRWDRWLAEHRDTRGTGLCELFCEYDTGHDRSPRCYNIPRACPDEDASICPRVEKLPWLAPDLSATVYGQRVALSAMAGALGRAGESDRWADRAEQTRRAIMQHCYDPDDQCFYDVDADGAFRKIRCDLLTRVLGEHVVDADVFEAIYHRYIRNPGEFWTPYPLPSVSVGDPQYIADPPENCWGGPTQALTAMRAPRWFEHYGKHDDLAVLMRTWVAAILRSDAFMQQMDPYTGEFSTSAGYSPAMCVFVDFVDRLDLLDTTPCH